jgi:hypothetical protein
VPGLLDTKKRQEDAFYMSLYFWVGSQVKKVPGSLDKKGGEKIPSMFHLCLMKDGTVFPRFLSHEPGIGKR